MANLILNTEALDDTDDWYVEDATVTANTHAAPAFAGDLAGMADTVTDASAIAHGFMQCMWVDIPADSNPYVGSVYIRKDAVTDRWPEVFTQISGAAVGKVSLNTSTGAIADGDSPPIASGVIDVDANWWRLWMRIANTGAGVLARMWLYPAHLDSLGGAGSSASTGSVVAWGFNLTQSTSVQTYDPEPFYLFDPPATTQNLYYRRRR